MSESQPVGDWTLLVLDGISVTASAYLAEGYLLCSEATFLRLAGGWDNEKEYGGVWLVHSAGIVDGVLMCHPATHREISDNYKSERG